MASWDDSVGLEPNTVPLMLPHDPREHFRGEPLVELRGAEVAVLGAGSVGGFASAALAGAGVGRLLLADKERLSEDNLRRHLATQPGRAKARLVAQQLRRRFSGVQVRAEQFCFLDRPERLRKLIAAAEIALVATDNEPTKYLVNDMLFTLRKPAVFAGVYGGGWGAEVILVDPEAGTACYGCAANAVGRLGVVIDQGPAYVLQRASTRPADSPATNGHDHRAHGNGSSGRSSGQTAEPGAELNGSLTPHTGRTNDWIQAGLIGVATAANLAADLMVAWLQARRGWHRALRAFQSAEDVSVWQFAIRRVPVWDLGPWELRKLAVRGNPACPQSCAPPPRPDDPPARDPALRISADSGAPHDDSPAHTGRPHSSCRLLHAPADCRCKAA